MGYGVRGSCVGCEVFQVYCLLQTLPALGHGRRVVTVILLNECRMEVMVEVCTGWPSSECVARVPLLSGVQLCTMGPVPPCSVTPCAARCTVRWQQHSVWRSPTSMGWQ